MPDKLWAEIILTGRLDRHRVHYFPSASSTNDLALTLSRQGAPDNTLVLADSQSAGRGRLPGRRWLSPPKTGLYFSLIIRPRLAPADFPKLALTTGLALCLALEKLYPFALALKWPNDLYLDGKKCGGILCEASGFADVGEAAAIIGVGLNISTPTKAFPVELGGKTTSLYAATGTRLDRGPVLAAILAELTDKVARLEQGGFAEILKEWRKRDLYAGRKIKWLNSRQETIRGLSLGPNEDGFLILRDETGQVHTIISGEVTVAG